VHADRVHMDRVLEVTRDSELIVWSLRGFTHAAGVCSLGIDPPHFPTRMT
jgi:hypothetical protein